MRIVLAAGALIALMVVASGCVRKGPYYIYGNYIEGHEDEEIAGEEQEGESHAP